MRHAGSELTNTCIHYAEVMLVTMHNLQSSFKEREDKNIMQLIFTAEKIGGLKNITEILWNETLY